jgi:hypothetical protein
LNGRELLCAVTSTALLPIIHILSSESARKVMIMREHELSVTKQVKALRMSRGSVYYLPRPVSATDLEIVRLLDRLHLDFPFAGSLTLQGLLPAEGCKVGRRHVKPLINRMGIRRSSSADHEARAGAQDLSLSAARDGNRPAEPGVAMDIPMVRGFVYRAVMLDCFGRRVLSGAYRSRWKRHSPSKRWRMVWPFMASQTSSSTRTGARSSPARRPPACSPTTACCQHGPQGCLAGQRVRQALVAQPQV